ncbi:MAG: thioesterase [Saprospiraceae bacterium]|nr:thioesterase [Saprospiraceae bacterium]
MPPELFFEYQHTIRSYEIDASKSASVPALIQIMHEAAMKHVLQLGLSAYELEKHHLAWVLIQQRIDILRLPMLGETIRIKTNPSGLERVITYRDFQILDGEGAVLAKASTSWLLMDTQTRKMARYPEDIAAILSPTNELEHLPRPDRKLALPEKNDHQKSFRIQYYDLDFNGHLSNFFYMKWMLLAFPFTFLQKHDLQHFDIKIMGESYLDEILESTIEQIDDQAYAHQLTRDDKVLAVGRTKWIKKT